ncbi:hypothetical protein AB0C04_31315 [Micromonospora sp. NPDC048909]|uniref:hypothetical protein n=1 Tax=Micromonospora sp. NPDC048909 TaxID=3155643 RepID=UPI0034010C29
MIPDALRRPSAAVSQAAQRGGADDQVVDVDVAGLGNRVADRVGHRGGRDRQAVGGGPHGGSHLRVTAVFEEFRPGVAGARVAAAAATRLNPSRR